MIVFRGISLLSFFFLFHELHIVLVSVFMLAGRGGGFFKQPSTVNFPFWLSSADLRAKTLCPCSRVTLLMLSRWFRSCVLPQPQSIFQTLGSAASSWGILWDL